MSLRDLVLYVGVCGGVLALLRELQAGVRAWRVQRMASRMSSRHSGSRTLPPAPPPNLRSQVVRHELACLVCGKRFPHYALDHGLEIARPDDRPCSPEKAIAP